MDAHLCAACSACKCTLTHNPALCIHMQSQDGSITGWNMCRDVRVGRSTGQLYYTACGTLIFRCVYVGVAYPRRGAACGSFG